MHPETHIKLKEKIESLKNLINEYYDSIDELKNDLIDKDEINLYIDIMDLQRMLKITYSDAQKTGWSVDKFIKYVEYKNSQNNG